MSELKLIVERIIQKDKTVYIGLLDLEKEFDSVYSQTQSHDIGQVVFEILLNLHIL